MMRTRNDDGNNEWTDGCFGRRWLSDCTPSLFPPACSSSRRPGRSPPQSAKRHTAKGGQPEILTTPLHIATLVRPPSPVETDHVWAWLLCALYKSLERRVSCPPLSWTDGKGQKMKRGQQKNGAGRKARFYTNPFAVSFKEIAEYDEYTLK